MVPPDIHDFFLASGGAAAALIGLLFVAVSVASERTVREGTGTPLYGARASAALTAFTNALTVSLFALIPGHKIGPATIAVASAGLVFIAASLLSLVRLRQDRGTRLRHGSLLVALGVTFMFQFIEGVDVSTRPADTGAVNTIAALVVVCFLLGIGRAWQLIGGPSISFSGEVAALVRNQHGPNDDSPGGAPSQRAAS